MNTEGVDSGSEPAPDEMYCPECGNIIKRRAEICPECGLRVSDAAHKSSGSSANAWAIGGLISFIVGLVILPIVFGPITIFTRYMIYSKSDGWFVGSALILGGSIELALAAILILSVQMTAFG
jgi:hypothetical protein